MVRTWKHILTKMPLNQYHNCEAKIFLIMTYEQLRSIRHILIVGLLGPQESTIYLYIGLVAQAEDKDLFEEGMSLSEGTVLMNKKANFGDNGS